MAQREEEIHVAELHDRVDAVDQEKTNEKELYYDGDTVRLPANADTANDRLLTSCPKRKGTGRPKSKQRKPAWSSRAKICWALRAGSAQCRWNGPEL